MAFPTQSLQLQLTTPALALALTPQGRRRPPAKTAPQLHPADRSTVSVSNRVDSALALGAPPVHPAVRLLPDVGTTEPAAAETT